MQPIWVREQLADLGRRAQSELGGGMAWQLHDWRTGHKQSSGDEPESLRERVGLLWASRRVAGRAGDGGVVFFVSSSCCAVFFSPLYLITPGRCSAVGLGRDGGEVRSHNDADDVRLKPPQTTHRAGIGMGCDEMRWQ